MIIDCQRRFPGDRVWLDVVPAESKPKRRAPSRETSGVNLTSIKDAIGDAYAHLVQADVVLSHAETRMRLDNTSAGGVSCG